MIDEAATTLRKPPHAAEAEQAVLGALMVDPRCFDAVGETLRSADFYDRRHARIFDAITTLAVGGKPCDVIAVFDLLRDQHAVDQIGGLPYLHELSQAVVSSHGAKRHADIVRGKALHRALVSTAMEALDVAWAPGDVSEKLDDIAAKFATLERSRMTRAPRRLAELLPERLDRLNEVNEGKATGWPTHIPTLDRMLNGGLQPGRVYILAARPSVGKSSLSEQIGLTLAGQGLPTLMLSQEMSSGEVADRALSGLSRVDYSALQTGRLEQEDWGRIAEGADKAAALPFFVDDQPALSLLDIRTKARAVKGLRCVIVDYLQLCSGSGDNRNAEVEAISRGLKGLAKELDIAVVNLSQLNRSVEQRANKRPQLSDLRDSGSIEQDADVVMFLWPHQTDGRRQVVGMSVEKNRQGRRGMVALDFDGDVQRWTESTASLDAPAARGREL